MFVAQRKFPRSFSRAILTGAITTVFALTLGGCGGGDDPPPTTLSGVLIDGPIRGATVFLDLNGNFQHDSGEPASLPTAADGAFSIVAQRLTQAQLATAMLVSRVPDTAFDADDLGLTLAQAARNGFILFAPVSATVTIDETGANIARPSVISPLTTLAAAEMAFNGLTLAQSKVAAQAVLPSPTKEVMSNFVADGDTELGSVARAAAIAFGEAGKVISDFAQTRPGGVAMREQVAATVAVMKAQLPAVVLGLGVPFTQLPSVPAVQAELTKPEVAEVLATALGKMGRP